MIGELKNFLADFIYKLEDRKGVLLRSFTSENLNKLLKDSLVARFEIDWLFLGQQIVLFEVGRSQKPSEPKTIVKDKLDQTVTRHFNTLQLIAHFIIKDFCKSSADESCS